MKRRPMVAGNWKMNKTAREASNLAQELSYEYNKSFKAVDIVLCPPYTALRSVNVTLGFDKSPMSLGAQDVFWEDAGAYTGAVSAPMLKEIGCSYCIIGHSERREHFNETDEMVNKKAQALIRHKIAPIICCGESLEIREAGATEKTVTAQVRAALAGINAPQAELAVIAYEPIWAIGTGRTATPEQADAVCAAIRATIASLYSEAFAKAIRILYGGSMKASNAKLFAPMPHIDGGLIGGASLLAPEFIEIVKAFL